MWRDTGNCRYLADTLGWNLLPLADRGLTDGQFRRQLGNATGRSDSSGGHVRHKRKVSPTYDKVNKAFAAANVRAAYDPPMFKETIKKIRKAKGLTQKQLGDKIGVSAAAVTQWEAGGGIDTDNLTNLAKALETPLEVLARALEHDQASQESAEPSKNLHPIKPPNDTMPSVTTPSEEGTGMGDGGLRDAVIQDLMKRLSRIENKLFSEAEEEPAKQGPRGRRKV